MKKPVKRPAVLKQRHHAAPPGFYFKDRKREANRKACRGKVSFAE